jgi:TRAP-type C4-dicarboxylate transport system substrate-binding protein
MAMETWNNLSQEEQELISQATEEAGNYETELTQQQLAEVYEDLKTKMEVITPDLASIREKLKGAFDDFEGDKWPEGLLEKIANVK